MGHNVTAVEAVKKLAAAGFVEVTQKGSHKKLRHPDGRWTIVPMHRGDLRIGLLRAIEKQTRLKLTD
jgi:predicted RNA binding protein YcfA (HicA-like mRNA interferase family)